MYKMFFPPRYIIRAAKSTIFIAIIFAIFLCFIYFTSEKTRVDTTFWDLIPYPATMAGFFILYGISYPLVSFVKKDAMLVKSFSEERINILNIFDSAGYELTSEKNGVLTFRLKSKFTRFMRLLGEDMIEVEYNEGKVSLSGLRRDIYRIARYIEYLNRK
ncbi:MAG: hypothetical protein LBS43_05150 [Prevotellaceae bacterium]|nr:hypothetical protein [Prevotellaceae bacterium]